MTPYELSVWEQYHIDQNGGIGEGKQLKNKINAITPEKRIMYSDMHNPCV